MAAAAPLDTDEVYERTDRDLMDYYLLLSPPSGLLLMLLQQNPTQWGELKLELSQARG
jgi:hypothetical protein